MYSDLLILIKFHMPKLKIKYTDCKWQMADGRTKLTINPNSTPSQEMEYDLTTKNLTCPLNFRSSFPSVSFLKGSYYRNATYIY